MDTEPPTSDPSENDDEDRDGPFLGWDPASTNDPHLERLLALVADGNIPVVEILADRLAEKIVGRLEEKTNRRLSPRTQALLYTGALLVGGLVIAAGVLQFSDPRPALSGILLFTAAGLVSAMTALIFSKKGL